MVEKLTKKQKKALEFREGKGKSEKKENSNRSELNDFKPVENGKKRALEDSKIDTNPSENSVEAPKKKRKTRRGKKGKGLHTSGEPRFILFVGNLPYTTTEASLREFFKKSKPDVIRFRQEKGIAFLEFKEAVKDEQSSFRSRMDLGLSKHHSMFEGRKINVELTAGGGGNSKTRLQKIQEKNLNLDEERRQNLVKKRKEEEEKKKKQGKDKRGKDTTTATTTSTPSSSIHPSRMALLQKSK